MQAQPSIVQHVVGIGRRADQAVGHTEQARPVLFEQGGLGILGVLRGTETWARGNAES